MSKQLTNPETQLTELTDTDLCHQLIGRLQFANALTKVLTVSILLDLEHIKNNKLYKGILLPGGKKATWKDVCRMVGLSQQHLDEQLQNLNKFGSEMLDTMNKAGIGPRIQRQLRKMDDQQLVKIEGKVVNAADKSEVIALIEDVIASKQESERTKKDLQHALTRTEAARKKAEYALDDLHEQIHSRETAGEFPLVIRHIREEATVLAAEAMDSLDRIEALMQTLHDPKLELELGKGEDAAYQYSAAATAVYVNLHAVYAQASYRLKLFTELVGKSYVISKPSDQPLMSTEEAARIKSRVNMMLISAENSQVSRHSSRAMGNKPRRGRPKGSKNKG